MEPARPPALGGHDIVSDSWRPRRGPTFRFWCDATAWCFAFAFAAVDTAFEFTFTRLAPALCAAAVAATLYVLITRPAPADRSATVAALGVAATTAILLAAVTLTGGAPVGPGLVAVAGAMALPLLIASRLTGRAVDGTRSGQRSSSRSPVHRPYAPPYATGALRATPAVVTGPAPLVAAGPAAVAPRVGRVAPPARLAGSAGPAMSTPAPLVPAGALVGEQRARAGSPDPGAPRRLPAPVDDRPVAPQQPSRARGTRTGGTGRDGTGRDGAPGRARTGGAGGTPRRPARNRRPGLTVELWGARVGGRPGAPDLTVYRTAVADLLARLAPHPFPAQRARVERILTDRLAEPALARVLTAAPGGVAGATAELLRELGTQQRRTAQPVDLVALVRIYLLSRIDAMWWGLTPGYGTDAEVLGAAELVDLDRLRRRKLLRFRYRRQAETLFARVTRAAERRMWAGRAPGTAGLLFTRARIEAAALLNRLARDFARLAPPGTPPLWVTSLTRSVEHQHRLRALGYAATLPSSHCVGYGMDIEMSWFRRFDAHRALEMVLLEHQACGAVNVIDEGQGWHVCVSPPAVAELRAGIAAEFGDDA